MVRTRFRVLATAVALTASGPAVAGDTEEIRTELDRIASGLTELERDYLAPALLEREYKLTARLSDGQLFFLTRDYARAAMVLLDVVEDPRSRSHPAYREALYYLAESLYQIGNYRLSARYFEELTKSGDPQRQQGALGRLLEIALETNDMQASRSYLERASRLVAAGPEPRLLYAMGKYHYRAGEYAEALGFFARVPTDHELGLRGRYFEGVIRVRLGELEPALEIFEGVARTATERAEVDALDADVADLARLASARIYYELARFDDAVAAYAAIPRELPHFDEALYESVWISIKQGDYEKALRKLEILLISQPDVVRGPDARLLQGQLLMMLGRFDDAALAFQEVLFEFGPIQTEMNAVVKDAGGDLVAYFNRVIGRNLSSFDLTSFLPARAAEFAGPDVEADRALALVRELAAEKRDVDEARRTIEKLEVALKADNRVEIFPRLHGAWLQAVEAIARLTRVRGHINDFAGAGITDPAYVKLRDERRAWEQRFEAVPTTVVELQARDARIDDEMGRLDREAFKLGIEIGALEAQLVAVDKYAADVEGDEQEIERLAKVRARVERELEVTRRLREELKALIRDIETERIQVGVNDYAATEDQEIRDRYAAALDAEEAWLRSHGAPFPETARMRVGELERRARSFLARASALVDERVADIERQLARERANIERYEVRLGAYQGETESLGGRIAARSFLHVKQRIDDVVLEADVGLIDVAWKHKEDKSETIDELLARKRAELDALQRQFDEVSGE